MPNNKNLTRRVFDALPLRRRRDALMFLLFLAISAVLWCVLSLNEEEQIDVRMPVKITHVPDSVTLLNPGPEGLTVSLRVQGQQRMRMAWGNVPTVNIDYRAYRVGSHISLSNAELKSLARSVSSGTQVSVLWPDSIYIPYTTHPGIASPISLRRVNATAGPRAALVGRPKLSLDTVRVYTVGGTLPQYFSGVETEPLHLENLNSSLTRRVRLVGPSGSRVIPDSVDISFEVEPLILKRRTVVIEPINVPRNIRLITFPAQVNVTFMVPMSSYAHTAPHLRVVADYRTINQEAPSKRMKLKLSDVPAGLPHAWLDTDSAEYIIEHL